MPEPLLNFDDINAVMAAFRGNLSGSVAALGALQKPMTTAIEAALRRVNDPATRRAKAAALRKQADDIEAGLTAE